MIQKIKTQPVVEQCLGQQHQKLQNKIVSSNPPACFQLRSLKFSWYVFHADDVVCTHTEYCIHVDKSHTYLYNLYIKHVLAGIRQEHTHCNECKGETQSVRRISR